jgi:nucleoside-diphosphate-sugar epimerase
MNEGRVVVVGGSGFVGSGVVAALRIQGTDVVAVPAPRLAPMPPRGDLARICERMADEQTDLSTAVRGASVVINTAGIPDASSLDEAALLLANAVVPGVLALLTRRERVGRFVHLSSAVVQGEAAILDDKPATGGFSPYARSKVRGEQLVAHLGGSAAIIYRPPSVHGSDRRVTRMTRRIARSPLATVAKPGTAPTPQTLIENVGSAVAFLATTSLSPPAIVTHPWEGLTTASLLRHLGGREPRQIPALVARLVVRALKWAAVWKPAMAAHARRVEMVWFGQRQATSWLEQAGWRPPVGTDAWARLSRITSDGREVHQAGEAGTAQ